MMELCKLHRKYLLSKTNYSIFIVLLVLISLAFFMSVQPLESKALQDLNRIDNAMMYHTNMQMITKLSLILVSCYLFGTSFNKYFDDYNVLYLSSNHNRLKYFYTKYSMLSFVFISLAMLCFIIYISIGYIYTTWFKYDAMILSYVFLVIIEGLIYGTLASLLSLLLNNLFGSLIPYVLFIVSEIINEQKDFNLFIKIYNFFCPSMIIGVSDAYFVFGIHHALIILFSLIILTSTLFLLKDIS